MRSFTDVSWSALLAGAAVFAAPLAAEASSGWVTGTLYFHNKNGGYCPSGASCSGNRYTEAMYDALLPIPEALVKVIRASDNAVIGEAITDANGDYLASWSSGTGTSSVGIKIQLHYTHKDGRYWVHPATDLPHDPYKSNSGTFTATHGTTMGSPQSLGGWGWGTTSTPIAAANVYWAAWMLWNYSLKNSNRMLTHFAALDIIAFDDNATATDCTDSCARPWFRLMTTATGTPSWAHEQDPAVVLDEDRAYNALASTLHEIGHVADFLSGPSQGLRRETGYEYDPDPNSKWKMTTLEYRPTAFNEGFATAIGMTAFLSDNAADPVYCPDAVGHAFSNIHCYAGFTGASAFPYHLEDGDYGSCSGEDGRKPVNSMRFIWDIIDAPNDDLESINLSLANVYDSLAAWPCPSYPACYASGQLHDAYSAMNATLSGYTVSNADLGNQWQFTDNMLNNYAGAYDVEDPYHNNCLGYF